MTTPAEPRGSDNGDPPSLARSGAGCCPEPCPGAHKLPRGVAEGHLLRHGRSHAGVGSSRAALPAGNRAQEHPLRSPGASPAPGAPETGNFAPTGGGSRGRAPCRYLHLRLESRAGVERPRSCQTLPKRPHPSHGAEVSGGGSASPGAPQQHGAHGVGQGVPGAEQGLPGTQRLRPGSRGAGGGVGTRRGAWGGAGGAAPRPSALSLPRYVPRSLGKGGSTKRVRSLRFLEKRAFAEREINAGGEPGAIGGYGWGAAGQEPREGGREPLCFPGEGAALQGAIPERGPHEHDPRCGPWAGWEVRGGSLLVPPAPGVQHARAPIPPVLPRSAPSSGLPGLPGHVQIFLASSRSPLSGRKYLEFLSCSQGGLW